MLGVSLEYFPYLIFDFIVFLSKIMFLLVGVLVKLVGTYLSSTYHAWPYTFFILYSYNIYALLGLGFNILVVSCFIRLVTIALSYIISQAFKIIQIKS